MHDGMQYDSIQD